MLTDRNPIELQEELEYLESTFKERETVYQQANLATFGLMLVGIIAATAMYNYIQTMLPACPPCNC